MSRNAGRRVRRVDLLPWRVLRTLWYHRRFRLSHRPRPICVRCIADGRHERRMCGGTVEWSTTRPLNVPTTARESLFSAIDSNSPPPPFNPWYKTKHTMWLSQVSSLDGKGEQINREPIGRARSGVCSPPSLDFKCDFEKSIFYYWYFIRTEFKKSSRRRQENKHSFYDFRRFQKYISQYENPWTNRIFSSISKNH